MNTNYTNTRKMEEIEFINNFFKNNFEARLSAMQEEVKQIKIQRAAKLQRVRKMRRELKKMNTIMAPILHEMEPVSSNLAA